MRLPFELLSNLDPSAYDVGAVPSTRSIFLLLDYRVAPTDDQRVRQALNYGIDKQGIIDALLDGHTSPSKGQVFNEALGAVADSVTAYPYDPDKARALLSEAGYPDGVTVKLAYSPGQYLNDDIIVQAIADQLSKVGVTVEITPIPHAEINAGHHERKHVAPMEYYGVAPQDASWQTYFGYFRSNFAIQFWENEEYDKLANQLDVTTDPAEQLAILNQGAKLIHDVAPVVFLWPIDTTYAVAHDVSYSVRGDDWVLPDEMRPAN